MALATHNTKPMIQNALRSLFARIGCEVGIDIFKASGDRLCDLQCIGNVIAPNDDGSSHRLAWLHGADHFGPDTRIVAGLESSGNTNATARLS